MKITKAKSIILKNMVERFYNTGKETFDFDTISSYLPNEPEHTIIKSLSSLKDDNFVSINYADNIPYTTLLKTTAIINVDEDTLLKKGYELIKEIKSFL